MAHDLSILNDSSRAALLMTAADLLAREEVEYSLGLDGDHLFNFTHRGTEVLTDSRGNQHTVELPPLPEEVGEAHLDYLKAKHQSMISLLVAEADRLRGNACGEGPLLWRDEDIAMADRTLPNFCVRKAGHGGPHSGRTEAQVEEVEAYLVLSRVAQRHGLTIQDVVA